MRRVVGWLRATTALLAHVRPPTPLLALASGRPTRVTFRDGSSIEMSHPLDALLWKEIWLDDEYGLRGLERPRCIVDVGAGVGLFSLAVARRFPACRVVAFEPDPRQLPRLRRNLAAGGATLVEVHAVAIGRPGRARLQLAPAPPRTSRRGQGVAFDASSAPLGAYLDETVDLLKVDCEGDELEVLESIEAPRWPLVQRVVVELHEALVPGVTVRVETLLRARGFVIHRGCHRREPALLRAARPRTGTA